MSQASIDSVQSWLSFELEQRGIDAVVYTRHILNLFMSSHFTTDLHLAKKEASIFARLPPGPNKNKPKQKYRKRSSSSPFLNDVSLKKEMAADCLRSACDNADDKDACVEALIDDLYVKLNDLNLLSDSNSSSDERRVGLPKEKRRESYHDAFPLLFDTPEDAAKVKNQLATVWNGQPIFKTQNPISTGSNHSGTAVNAKPMPVFTVDPAIKWGSNKHTPQQLKINGRNKKISNQRRSSRRRSHPFDSVKKSPNSNRRRAPHFQQRKRERPDFDKENAHERKTGFAFERKKNGIKYKEHKQASQGIGERKSFFNNAGATITLNQVVDSAPCDSFVFHSSRVENGRVSNSEKDISHLYSMGLPDFHDNSEDPPCSKWFRDPQSGFLEFEPAYKNRGSSDTSPSSVESWLWCPSPSLWDDAGDSPSAASQSRFETIYKPPARSTSSDSQADQLWKDYEAIFVDVAQDRPPSHHQVDALRWSDGDGAFHCFDSNRASDLDEQRVNPVSCCNDPWLGDTYQLFVDDSESVGDACGGFSSPPVAPAGQSRKEIWLKNAKGLNESKHGVMFIHGDNNVKESFRDRLQLDDFLLDLSCQIRDCCNLHWLFGWDISKHISADPFVSMTSQLPFSTSQLNFSRFEGIYTNAFRDSFNEDGIGLNDDVFAGSLYSSEADNIPWALVFEDASDPLQLLSDSKFASGHTHKQDPTNSTSSLLEDCVTENQAWKSSLRIGNMWQSISGIRRVNVLYSEKQVDNNGGTPPILPPSSCTHFIPIHENDLDSSDAGIGSALLDQNSSDSVDLVHCAADDMVDLLVSPPKEQHASCDGCSDCDMKIRGLEQDLDNLLGDGPPKVPPQSTYTGLNFRFCKTGEDKSMQTTFEEHLRQIDDDICKSLSIRPPKANSR